MNRNQIENKIVKIFGGIESQKSFLIEKFIGKLFEKLELGQGIKIPDLGYFFKITFDVVNQSKETIITKENQILIFSTVEDLKEFTDDQIFWRPIDFEFDNSRNLLSISVGKEFISNNLIQSGNLFIPVTDEEYQNVYESKIDNCIESAELISKFIDEVPSIKFDTLSNQHSLDFNIIEKIESESILQTTSDKFEGFESKDKEIKSFNFSDLLEELKELDSSKDETIINDVNQETAEKEFKTDDFISEEKPIIKENFQNTDVEQSLFEKIIDTDFLEENEILNDKKIPESESLVDTPSDVIESVDDIDDDLLAAYESSWDKIISDISSEDNEIDFYSFFDDSSISSENSKNIDKDVIIDEPNSFITSESEKYKFEETVLIEKDAFDNIIETIDQTDKVDELIEESDFNLQNENLTSKYYEEPQSFNNRVESQEDIQENVFEKSSDDPFFNEKELESLEEEFTSKQIVNEKEDDEILEDNQKKKFKLLYPFLILIFVLLIAGIVYNFYPQYINFIYGTSQVYYRPFSMSEVTKIERDFKIPVTYPYPPLLEKNNNPNNIDIKIETNSHSLSSDERNNELITNQSENSQIKDVIEKKKNDLETKKSRKDK